MNKANRSFIIITIVIITAIAAIWLSLNHLQKKSAEYSVDMYRLVPPDAIALVHIKDVFHTINDIDSSLFESENIHPKVYKCFLDSLNNKVELKESLSASQSLISLHQKPGGKINCLFQIKFEKKLSQRQLEEIFFSICSQKKSNNYNYLDAQINEVKTKNSKSYYWSLFKGNLLLSADKQLVEHSITYFSSERGINKNKQLASLRNTAGAFSNNLYVNFQKIKSITPNSFTTKTLPFGVFSNLAGWGAYDITADENSISLNGYLAQSANNNCFVSVLNNEEKFEEDIFNYIPAHTSVINIVGTGKITDFEEKIKAFYSGSNFMASYMKATLNIEEKTNNKIQKLKDILYNAIAYGFAYNPETEKEFDFVLIKTTDPDELISFFTEAESFSKPETLSQTKKDIFINNDSLNLTYYLSAGLIKSKQIAFAVKDSFLISTNSEENLLFYLEKLKYGQTITSNKGFMSFYNTFSQRSNYFFYSDFPFTEKQQALFLSDEASDFINKNSIFESINDIGIDIIQHRESSFYNLITLKRSNGQSSSMQPQAWETTLGASVKLGPFLTFNHNNQDKEIILQDDNNHLYLLNNQGLILWEKEISGPIMSDIYQVDIYKNNKYQYLFNTRNYLHLIDRNGNYVRGFPTRLQRPASAGMALFDYENNKNYRILVPAENKQIYNYTIAGKPVTGWKRPVTNDTVFSKPQHIRFNNKDYILFTDKKGNLQITNRRGRARVNVPDNVLISKDSQIYKGNYEDQFFFVAAGKNGELFEIYPDGNINTIIIDSLFKDPGFAYNPSGDNFSYVYMYNNKLFAYDKYGKKAFDFNVPDGNCFIDELAQINNEYHIPITDKKNNKLYLLNNKGKLLVPFPLDGNTAFIVDQIAENDIYYIITAYNNKIIAYKK
ncbi:MAG: hypothetical protein R6U11_11625 [Bacteroidales bacterium]